MDIAPPLVESLGPKDLRPAPSHRQRLGYSRIMQCAMLLNCSQEEFMRVVYIILAHKLPEQLVRLVQRLNTDETHFLVHVEKTASNGTYQGIARALSTYSNVIFLKRYVIRRAQIGHVRAPLEGIRELVARRLQYDYLILLSGQDYPLKSNREIQTFLSENRGRSFIEYFSSGDPEWEMRVAYWHLFLGGLHLAFPKVDMFPRRILNRPWNVIAKRVPLRRKFPRGLVPYYGSAYWCLERECVEYIHEFAMDHKDVLDFFRHAEYPSEAFFQTVLLNSPLRDRLVNDHLRYIDWSQPLLGPRILGMHDVKRLVSSDKMFARKFDATVDADVLDVIDKAIV